MPSWSLPALCRLGNTLLISRRVTDPVWFAGKLSARRELSDHDGKPEWPSLVTIFDPAFRTVVSAFNGSVTKD
jgi:hypothetical protein